MIFHGLKKKLNIKMNFSKIKYNKYEKNCDESLIKNENLPIFYDMVITNNYLTKSSKTQFLKKFWNKYNNDIEYRKSVIGKYLLWVNKKFIGIVDNILDVDNYGPRTDLKYLIQITNNGEKNIQKQL
jgi:hypothetical protein